VTQAADRVAARLYRKRDRHFLNRQYHPWDRPLKVLEDLIAGGMQR